MSLRRTHPAQLLLEELLRLLHCIGRRCIIRIYISGAASFIGHCVTEVWRCATQVATRSTRLASLHSVMHIVMVLPTTPHCPACFQLSATATASAAGWALWRLVGRLGCGDSQLSRDSMRDGQARTGTQANPSPGSDRVTVPYFVQFPFRTAHKYVIDAPEVS
jgi:hypothetical protein